MSHRKTQRLRSKSKSKSKYKSMTSSVRKRKVRPRKTFKGGSFFSDANYLMQKVSNVFSSNPQVPYGNATVPVPPFSYFQNI
jgi:hypothetical protein